MADLWMYEMRVKLVLQYHDHYIIKIYLFSELEEMFKIILWRK
jgi:hypothetical protein